MEKMLPLNIEAEMGVLGSMIIDPEAVDQVIGFLHPEDFYRNAHRLLYEVIVNLHSRGVPADYITISNELERCNHVEDVGGAGYITSLIRYVPTSGNILYYGRIVQRTGVLRRLVAVAGEIAALGYEDDIEVEAALDLAEQKIFEISQRYLLSTSTDVGMGTLITEYMTALETRYDNRGRIVGIPTGYADLDRLLGGLQKSDLDILAARTSIGKTQFAVNIAYNAAMKYQRHVGIFSLEMTKEQLAQRFMALESKVEQQKLRTGYLEEGDWPPIIDAAGKLIELGERGIRIDDTPGITLLQMRSRARRWVADYGIELLIVDYLQLIEPSEKRKQDNREQEVSRLSRGLKTIARELNVPILALAQLSRAVENRQSKVPQLSDLRESGSIEQEADVVMFIYRDEVYNAETDRKHQADIIVAKQRNGPVGEVALYFDQTQGRFSNLETAFDPELGEITFADEKEHEEREYPPTEDEEEEE